MVALSPEVDAGAVQVKFVYVYEDTNVVNTAILWLNSFPFTPAFRLVAEKVPTAFPAALTAIIEKPHLLRFAALCAIVIEKLYAADAVYEPEGSPDTDTEPPVLLMEFPAWQLVQ